MEPQPTQAYPLVLGPSFDRERGDRAAEICTLRLDFIPASANKSSEAIFHVDEDVHQARLQLPSATGGAYPVEFQGKYERTSASEALDCVAVFDGTSFRLELLDAHAGLRHAPGAEREAKAAAQRDAAAAAEAAAKAKKQPRKAAARKAPPAEPQPEQVPLEGDVPGGALNEIEAAFFGGADDLD